MTEVQYLLVLLCDLTANMVRVCRNHWGCMVEFANLQALVTKLGKAIPEVILILQQEDWELASRGADMRVLVLDLKPAYDLPLYD